MQLNHKTNKLSFVVAAILATTTIYADDYVRVNYMQYDENDNRVSVKAPSFEVNKELGVDYTLNGSFVYDSVSGGTPVYSDTTSGASAFNRGTVADTSKIKKDNIDFTEGRMNASISLVKRLENRDEITTGFSKSYESDYDSNTLSVDYLHWNDSSKNRSYNIGGSYQANNILIKNCSYNSECGTPDTTSGASEKKSSTVLSTEVGLTQIIDKKSLAKVSLFYSGEDGYLSNPYYNVVRDTNRVVAENRPDKRVAYGFNLKYIRAFSDTFSSKFKYKFYTDDWDISSHTIDINNYYELSDKYIIGFGIRYYTQSEAQFYSEDITYFTNEIYASHDERLSSFNSQTYKTSLDYKYNDKISYNVSLDMYTQSTGLKATYSTVGLKYKF